MGGAPGGRRDVALSLAESRCGTPPTARRRPRHISQRRYAPATASCPGQGCDARAAKWGVAVPLAEANCRPDHPRAGRCIARMTISKVENPKKRAVNVSETIICAMWKQRQRLERLPPDQESADEAHRSATPEPMIIPRAEHTKKARPRAILLSSIGYPLEKSSTPRKRCPWRPTSRQQNRSDARELANPAANHRARCRGW